MTSLPSHGELSEWPLPRVLVALYRERFEGALELAREHTRKRFVFDAGAPARSESNRPSETLAALLEERGTLGRAARARLEAHVERNGCSEAAGLLALGLIDSQALFHALRGQLRRRLLDCMAWPKGSFRVQAGKSGGPQSRAFRCDPYRLVQEGLAAHWAPERVLADLTGRLDSIPEPTAGLASVAARLERDPALDRALATLAGRAPLAQVLGTASSSPSALAAIWLLDATDLFHYASAGSCAPDAGAEADDAQAEASIEIEVVGARAETATPAAREPGASQRDPAPPQSDEALAMATEVRALRERLDEIDHFEVLGLTREAAAAAVRKAYFGAAKRYHPDALNRLGLDAETRALAGEVFARIAQANEVLGDADKRRDYEAWLDDDQRDIDVNRVAMAEKAFRKGEILVRMGDFRGALEFLEQAVELWPEDATYQSTLGWALFRKTPPEIERALAHLEQALALDPKDVEATARLEKVKAAGAGSPPGSA